MKTRFIHFRLAMINLTALFIAMIDLHGQDYIITFAGIGATTIVDSVKIENLVKGTKLEMAGTDILHLTIATGIETMNDHETGKVRFYPNPMKDITKMQFFQPEPGETLIAIYDISGRKLSQIRHWLSPGTHIYRIQGIKGGLYIVYISSGRFSCSGRFLSSGSQNADSQIEYEATLALHGKQENTKGIMEEKVMQFNPGDRLRFIGISGNYSTVLTDVPAENKTITFSFIACSDGEGNNYPVIEFLLAKGNSGHPGPAGEKGIQIWMAENLKATKYNDGTAIPHITDNTMWYSITTPAYCWYKNEIVNKETYGALYNWYAISTGKLCPAGWHVSTDAEWIDMLTWLGGETISGGKLKGTGFSHWSSPNTGATNETGFTGMPGGARVNGGLFELKGKFGGWWINKEFDYDEAWYRYLNYDNRYVYKDIRDKDFGFSIRCLKD